MADSKIKLTKADRFKAFLRSYFLLASQELQKLDNSCTILNDNFKKLKL